MKIIMASFKKSLREPDPSALARDALEVCFIGRSNVGKSSLINRLVSRRIARTSSTPGATQLINLYDVQYEHKGTRRSVVFSDFPGFGYAKVSKETYRNWEGMIGNYIRKNRSIRHIIWLIDVRRDFDSLDEAVVSWLEVLNIPYTVVITKADKEGHGFGQSKKTSLRRALPGIPVILFSAKEEYGREELLSHIAEILEDHIFL
jgi:GTP-binding protein